MLSESTALSPSFVPEGADIPVQSLARAALTRRRTSKSAGIHRPAATRSGRGLSGSADTGALTDAGAGAGLPAASGGYAALLGDAGLVIG
jgi:hypothetical protein